MRAGESRSEMHHLGGAGASHKLHLSPSEATQQPPMPLSHSLDSGSVPDQARWPSLGSDPDPSPGRTPQVCPQSLGCCLVAPLGEFCPNPTEHHHDSLVCFPHCLTWPEKVNMHC